MAIAHANPTGRSPLMEMSVEYLNDGIKKINLKGRMDIEGTQAIDLRLATETSVQKALIVVDLSLVEFVASVGLGVLVRSAKALRLRGGKIVLLNPQPVVALVLEKTGIHEVISIYRDLNTASDALRKADS
jgi:anti-sigma B factor antagonist